MRRSYQHKNFLLLNPGRVGFGQLHRHVVELKAARVLQLEKVGILPDLPDFQKALLDALLLQNIENAVAM